MDTVLAFLLADVSAAETAAEALKNFSSGAI